MSPQHSPRPHISLVISSSPEDHKEHETTGIKMYSLCKAPICVTAGSVEMMVAGSVEMAMTDTVKMVVTDTVEMAVTGIVNMGGDSHTGDGYD